MKDKHNSSEKGQVLILVVFGLVGLLAFTALAVDGSMIYSDRRLGQNSADAASLAGGSEAANWFEAGQVNVGNWSCSKTEVVSAITAAMNDAISRAADNGMTISPINFSSLTSSDTNYVSVECVNSGGERYADIIVQIELESNTSFVHLFYSGPVAQTVRSVTRVRPRAPFAFGQAIVALNPAACSGQKTGFQTHGAAKIYVFGGGIFSNGCMRDSGGKVYVYDAGFSYVGQLYNNKWSNFYVDDVNTQPSKVASSLPPTAYAIDTPNCAHKDAKNVTGSFIENYYKTNGQPLPPGLYCVTGGIKITNDKNPIVGYEVTIFMLNGAFDFNGGKIVLTAPPEGASPAVPGIVMYAAPTNTTTWKLNGNGESQFTGVILAPGVDLELEGNGEQNAFNAQIIVWNVEAGGTSDLYVNYTGSIQASLPTFIDLWR